MALFNYANREITAKVVYYGPGVCGKTTSLQYIHERISPSQRGRLLSLATETDRTIFFDLLPLKLGEINGFKLRFQLYTVPGQVKYNKTRKLVLQGSDAVVFVADSQVSRREANIESFKNLQENLLEQNRKLDALPLVYEFNKRDMEKILSIDDLNKDVNPKNLPFFPTIATQGVGVMEALEAISKQALRDLEQRLTSQGETTEKEPETDLDDDLLLESDLADLTIGEGDDELSFSTEELDSLDLDTGLGDLEEGGGLSFDDEGLESKPIGYGNNIAVEELELPEDNVAHTGTLKESEFFDLQEVEEQALRELDEFLAGEGDDELSYDEQLAGDDDSTLDFGDESTLNFDVGDDTAASSGEPLEKLEESELDFFLDDDSGEKALSADLETETEEDSLADVTSEDDLLSFNLEEDAQQEPEAPSASGEIESLDLSDSDLDLSFDEQDMEDTQDLPAFTLDGDETQEDSTSISPGEDELTAFNPDDLSEEASTGEIESLDLSESDLDMTFGEDTTEEQGDELSELESQEEEFPDFNITDSVKFEMQHGEELSSITPFEKQLDELSEDVFSGGEEEATGDEFEPELSETEEEEEFQDISDEWTRLIVLVKYLYHRAETFRAQHTTSGNIQAIFMYYAAIETAGKAVASKYETCNPEIASFHLMMESIEEETEKPVTGLRSIKDNVVAIMNTVQLEAAYPDDETCELAARMTERFLTTFSQDFLTIDFSKLSPILARPETE